MLLACCLWVVPLRRKQHPQARAAGPAIPQAFEGGGKRQGGTCPRAWALEFFLRGSPKVSARFRQRRQAVAAGQGGGAGRQVHADDAGQLLSHLGQQGLGQAAGGGQRVGVVGRQAAGRAVQPAFQGHAPVGRLRFGAVDVRVLCVLHGFNGQPPGGSGFALPGAGTTAPRRCRVMQGDRMANKTADLLE